MSEKKTLNQKIDELDSMTEWFYSDDFKLDEAIKKYKELANLAEEIEGDLKKLKNEVEVIAEDFQCH
ncbi:MAG: hypothetical protein Q4A79_00715 [Candidatus Saccharibacteria bacterium]|nr:hypothetical protein [Candidatus Saccharibacteria bacterium]